MPRDRAYVPTSTKAFGARERTVVQVNSMWTQPSWPLSCPVAHSRVSRLHTPASLVSTSRPLGTHGMLSSTMMAPGRQPPASVRPRPKSPSTMVCHGIGQDDMRNVVRACVNFDQTPKATSLLASGKLNFRPPTMLSGYSDGYLMLPPKSPGKALLDRRYADSAPRLKSASTRRLHSASSSWSSRFSLDGTSPRPKSAQSESPASRPGTPGTPGTRPGTPGKPKQILSP